MSQVHVQLKIFAPEESDLTANISLLEFFDTWVRPTRCNQRHRKPLSEDSFKRMRYNLLYWDRLTAIPERPGGPWLCEITPDHLAEFSERLKTATYKRGRFSRELPISPVTRVRILEDVHTVLGYAGPTSERRMRAGLLAHVPAIYVEDPESFPKPTWGIDEARRIYAAAGQSSPPPRGRRNFQASLQATAAQWQTLAKGLIALWFYTGHRAKTFTRLRWADLVEVKPGDWRLLIKSVKTGKRERVAVHSRLLHCINAIRDLRLAEAWQLSIDKAGLIFPVPIGYRSLLDHHMRWCQSADVRVFSPQAWRRLQGDCVSESVFDMAKSLTQRSLGHSSSDTTTSFYSNAALDLVRLSLPDLESEVHDEPERPRSGP